MRADRVWLRVQKLEERRLVIKHAPHAPKQNQITPGPRLPWRVTRLQERQKPAKPCGSPGAGASAKQKLKKCSNAPNILKFQVYKLSTASQRHTLQGLGSLCSAAAACTQVGLLHIQTPRQALTQGQASRQLRQAPSALQAPPAAAARLLALQMG